jgi:proline iminopeptidase
MNKKEGFIETSQGKIWYQIVGEKKNIPLIIIHGGPGACHDSLEPLEDLSKERQVIFYDQLGCGNSDRNSDRSAWTVEYFVSEIQELIKYLNLNKYHILGHSWGAALAVAFALTKPKGLVSMVLADPYISTPEWAADAKRLMKKLPEHMQKILEKNIIDSEEYKNASKEYYTRFIKRLEPVPEPILRAGKKMNMDIYNYMWGPKEYLPTGTLKNFNQTDRLSQITVPVLLLCGRYDEATPESTEHFQKIFPDAQVRIFEQSAHFPHWNEREDYMQTVQSFLAQAIS